MNYKRNNFSFAPSADSSHDHAAIPAFTPIVSDCFNLIENLPAPETVPAGTVLLTQGEQPKYIFLVKHGLVKLVHLNQDGRELTIGLRTDGWYAGSTSVLLNAPSIYGVQAITECVVVRLPAKDFSLTLMQNAKLRAHFFTTLCHEVAAQASMQVELMASSASDRLEHFMQEREQGHHLAKTIDPLPLLKQMELAQLLAITPEHLSRLLHKKGSPRSGYLQRRTVAAFEK